MRIRKFISKATIVLAVSICLGAVSAHAAKPINSPKDSGRDVIGDAQTLCGLSWVELEAVCTLRSESNGKLNDDSVCAFEPYSDGSKTSEFLNLDNGVVDYYLRNCDKNEASLVRSASSAVLSLYDYVAKGKDTQMLSAANYLCGYATKYDQLVGTSKLFVDVPADPTVDPRDLGEDARDLADAISGGPSYCDDL